MSSRRGKEAEFFFDLRCTQLGYDVAVPITGDAESYDRVVRIGNRWNTVQVKRVYLKGASKSRTINLVKHNDEPYKHTDFDILAAVDMETGDIWLVPINAVAGYTRRRITSDYERWRLQ